MLLSLSTPVLITIAAITAMVVLIVFLADAANGRAVKRKEEQRRRGEECEQERDRLFRERAASLKRTQQEAARQKKQQVERRGDALGKHGASLVKRAESSVRRVVSSEAARDGWLGDVDFTLDLEEIEANLLKARALRGTSGDLSALPKPNDDDRKIIAEAKATIAQLEQNVGSAFRWRSSAFCGGRMADPPESN